MYIVGGFQVDIEDDAQNKLQELREEMSQNNYRTNLKIENIIKAIQSLETQMATT